MEPEVLKVLGTDRKMRTNPTFFKNKRKAKNAIQKASRKANR